MKRRPVWFYVSCLTVMSAVPLIALVWLSLKQSLAIAETEMARTTSALTASTANQVSRYFSSSLSRVDKLVRLPEVVYGTRADRNLIFERLHIVDPTIDNIAMLLDSGEEPAASRPWRLPDEPIGQDGLRLPPGFDRAMAIKSPTIAEAVRFDQAALTTISKGPMGRHWLVSLGAAVKPDGKRIGCIIVTFRLVDLSRILLADSVTPSTSISVVDSQGRLVLHAPDPERFVGQMHPSAAEILKAGKTGKSIEATGLDGLSRLFSVRPIPGTTYYAVSSVSIEVALAEAKSSLRRYLLGSAAILLAALAGSYAFGRLMAVPTQKLALATRQHVPGSRIVVPRGASLETEEVTKAINDLIAANEKQVEAIRQAEAERLEIVRRAEKGARMECLGMLAGGVAHDFNNMLTGVNGFLSLALSDLDEKMPARDYVAKAAEASTRARELCGQMLNYAGRGRKKAAPIDLSVVVQETIGLVGASHRSVTFKTEFAAERVMVFGDATNLHQVAMNLLVNACEAMPNRIGTVIMRTSVENHEARREGDMPSGQYARLEVSDNGSGMPPEVLAKIYEPFFTTKEQGTGIGLATAVGIVRTHGGRMEVESKVGVGTTFTIWLPLYRVPVAAPDAGSGAKRILLIDDDGLVRASIKMLLKSSGFAADAVADGREALRRAAESPQTYVGIILDLNMPEMDGAETLAALRANGVGAPAILISGLSDNPILARIPRNEYSVFLTKPVDPTDLLAAVSALVT